MERKNRIKLEALGKLHVKKMPKNNENKDDDNKDDDNKDDDTNDENNKNYFSDTRSLIKDNIVEKVAENISSKNRNRKKSVDISKLYGDLIKQNKDDVSDFYKTIQLVATGKKSYKDLDKIANDEDEIDLNTIINEGKWKKNKIKENIEIENIEKVKTKKIVKNIKPHNRYLTGDK